MTNPRWKKISLLVVLVLLAALAFLATDRTAAAGDAEYDLVIKNGRVIDPETGRDEIAAVAIKGGTIVKIVPGRNVAVGQARQVIDAAGRVVAPGFINTHTHEGVANATADILSPTSQIVAFDGVTFWLGGNCGVSPTGARVEAEGVTLIDVGDPETPLADFFQKIETIPLYSNYATLSGNITLRSRMGLKHMEKENDEQIEKMKKILAEELDAGSFGVSSGIMYDMGATEKSLVALARVSKEHGGMAASHLRYPLFNLKHLSGGIDNVVLKRSIYEAINNCRQTKVPFIISHITDIAQAGSTRWTLETIDKAIKEGLPLAGDIIGHDFLTNDFYVLTFKGKIPAPVMFKLGNYTIDQFYAGRDVYVDGKLFVKKYGQVTMEEAEYLRKNVEKIDGFGEGFLSLPLICKIMPPEDTMRALNYPWVFMGNDTGGAVIDPATGEPVSTMPRPLATFSRLLGHWSREEQALTLHQALFKATIAPALWLGLDKKGRLQEGCDADIVIFDPDTIIDRAGWLDGMENIKPDGISRVIVGGQVVVENNKLTGATPGRLVRRTWKIPGDTAALINLYQKRFSVR